MNTKKRYLLPLIALLIVFCSVGVVDAQALYKVRSKYYNIQSNLEREELKRWARHMDLVCKTYRDKFGNFKNQTGHKGRFNMILVNTNQEYLNVLARYGINGVNSGGMFFSNGQTDCLITWVKGVPESFTIKTLQHEGFHQYNHHFIGRQMPIWANEGLAEYFGDGVIIDDGRSLKLGIADYQRIMAVKNLIKTGRALPFQDLIYMTHAQWNQNLQSGAEIGHFQYAQSWSVAYFLIHGKNGKYRKAFTKYLKALSFGMDNQEAFFKAFKTRRTDSFGKQWREYMLKVKPDDRSAALMKLEFLAQGMQKHYSDEMPNFTKIDQLKNHLQKRKFKFRGFTHGAPTISAADESLYYYTIPEETTKYPITLRKSVEQEKKSSSSTKKRKRKGSRKKAVKKSPLAGKPLPPQIVASKFDKEIILSWQRDESGAPVYRIQMVKAKKKSAVSSTKRR